MRRPLPAGCSCGDVIDNATATGWVRRDRGRGVMRAHLYARVGWRGWLMVTLAPWWVFFGLHAALASPLVSEGTPIEVLPWWLRGLMWVGSAAYAVYAAGRPELHGRAIGILTLMPSARLISYAVQAIAEVVRMTVGWDAPWASLPFGWLGWAHSVALYGLLLRASWMTAQITPRAAA